jgi:RND family efflux transporter MFP subunit
MTGRRFTANTPGGADPGAPPPGAGIMNVVRWVLFGGLMLLAAVSIGAYVASRRAPAGTKIAAAQAVYRCPMHPSYTSDKPGECPICGMALERVEAAGAAPAHGGDVPGLATVELSPERIQMIGVRTAVVERRVMGDALELTGFVTPDESRLHRVQLRVSGWVRGLHVSRTGEAVRAGETLLTLYSPELLQTEQEYLIEAGPRDTMTSMAMSHDAAGRSAALERLELLGVPRAELERLQRERRASTELAIVSPATGTVLERGVTEGQSVSADTPLFTIADLTHVWVLADLYEMEMGRVQPGATATFTADALPGRTFASRVEFVSPTVSSDTRTAKARLALANPGGVLRPGMYGRVRTAEHTAPALVIPADALVDAGEHLYVFVAHAGGRFEPRQVTVGLRRDEAVQVLTGLAAGDTVVSSASFLIDSESRMKAAIAGMGAAPAPAGH